MEDKKVKTKKKASKPEICGGDVAAALNGLDSCYAAGERPADIPPILLAFGTKDGELCNRNGCLGMMEYSKPVDCSCHINAPCSACTSVYLYCPICEADESSVDWIPEILLDATKGEMSMSCDVNQVGAAEQSAIDYLANSLAVFEYRHKCGKCDGAGFLPVGFERSNTYAFAKRELEILTADVDPENPPIVMQFLEPILELCDVFGKSGQSGGSAVFVNEVITNTLKNLLAQKPIAPITGADDEWVDMTEYSPGEPTFQNNRLAAVFKHDVGPAYFVDAVIFKDTTGRTFTASSGALLKDGKRVHNRQNITFPFRAKTFYIDVRSRNDNWVVVNQVQVDKMREYYK